ncbi:hypothetical protein ASPFODRAFT_51045, partial [Aspergillus luchuensis CBS 106.47]
MMIESKRAASQQMDCQRAGRDEPGRASVENLGTGTRIGKSNVLTPGKEKAGQQTERESGREEERDEKEKGSGGGSESRSRGVFRRVGKVVVGEVGGL